MSYDILKWSWTTFLSLVNWTIQMVINIINVSIIIPVWLIGKHIVIHEWATLFLWKYNEYIASSLFMTDFTRTYYIVWAVIGGIALFHILAPITYPITALLFTIIAIILAWTLF